MPVRSLQGRLQIGLGISLILLLAAIWALGHEALHRVADAFVLSRLQHDAEALVSAVQIGKDGRPRIGQRRLTPIYNQPYSGHYFALETEDGTRILSRALWDRDLEVRPLAPGQQASWRAQGPVGQRLLVWGGGFSKGGLAFSLAVAEDVSPLTAELISFEWLLAGIAFAGLIALALVQRIVVRRSLRQLQPVYRDIERLERGDAVSLTERVPSEVLPLVSKLNGLLALYRRRLERSRHAAGNLAHALKTPLNLLVQGLEHTDPPLSSATRESLNGQVDRIRRLMERELKRARFAGSAAPGQRFDPHEELPVLGHLLERIYDSKHLEIQLHEGSAKSLPLDREDMLELLGNLLDNACKWAAHRVTCGLSVQGERLLIEVEDDGPGCPPGQITEIANRGVRLDESVAGHGLGLSIVQDIVGLYQGRLALDRSQALGGFAARVNLPLDPLETSEKIR
jgi:signal transduction histidine kinase